jgi:hypothetical protein
VVKVCFDAQKPERFLVMESKTWHLYVYRTMTVQGGNVLHAQCTDAIKGGSAQALVGGKLIMQLESGQPSSKILYNTDASESFSGLDTSSQVR